MNKPEIGDVKDFTLDVMVMVGHEVQMDS